MSKSNAVVVTKARKKKTWKRIITYAFLVFVGFFMIYPLVWLFFSTFKTNTELFGKLSFFPETFTWEAFVNGWKGSGQYTYTTFYLNTFALVLPTVIVTVLSTGICLLYTS